MKLGEKQRKLCRILNTLETFAFESGYELVREDARRAEEVHGKWGVKKSYASAFSVHKIKLGQDYSLFKGGKYLTGDAADEFFAMMHDLGDELGLAPRITGDLGHFSMEHGGYWQQFYKLHTNSDRFIPPISICQFSILSL